ncbi:unnamed protein product [Linum tenue]|uniref:Uncharacterized protein n=2 Tax=Linum tenue TaxID=586396 RepID=A0AAV0PWU8_9ROSI|nr:unnamed protein product [Linum tenue]
MARQWNSHPLLVTFCLLALWFGKKQWVIGEPVAPCFFIFGDSLVDGGNNNFLNTAAKVDYLPYGVDFPGGPTGRFSNGKTVADVISESYPVMLRATAERLGLPNYIPAFASAIPATGLLQGVNYASGSAGILVETGKFQGNNIDLSKQLSNHQVTVSRFGEVLGNEEAVSNRLKQCLYYVNIGSNDYINNYFLPQFSNASKEYSPGIFAFRLVGRYYEQIKTLYNLGARKIALAGISKIGCTPFAKTIAGRKGCVDSQNEAVVPFNKLLRDLAGRLNQDFPDAKFVYLDTMAATDLLLRSLPNTQEPCCQVQTVGLCIPNGTFCDQRDTYVYWDAFHPTQAANYIVGPFLYQTLKQIL